jgi:hypothetical protein
MERKSYGRRCREAARVSTHLLMSVIALVAELSNGEIYSSASLRGFKCLIFKTSGRADEREIEWEILIIIATKHQHFSQFHSERGRRERE